MSSIAAGACGQSRLWTRRKTSRAPFAHDCNDRVREETELVYPDRAVRMLEEDEHRERLLIRLFGPLTIEGAQTLGPRDLGGSRPKQVLRFCWRRADIASRPTVWPISSGESSCHRTPPARSRHSSPSCAATSFRTANGPANS